MLPKLEAVSYTGCLPGPCIEAIGGVTPMTPAEIGLHEKRLDFPNRLDKKSNISIL